MRTIERVMRVMTHVNIGATLGMATCVAWSDLQVVSGDWKVPKPAASEPAQQRTERVQPVRLPCCFTLEVDAAARRLEVHRHAEQSVAAADISGAR